MSNNLLLHVQNQADSCKDRTEYYEDFQCKKCPQIDHMHESAVIHCTHGYGQHTDDRKFANATDTNLCKIGYYAKFGVGNAADSCQLIDTNLDSNLDTSIIVLVGIVSVILVVVAVIMFLKFKKKKDIVYQKFTNVSSPSPAKLNF